uniref:RRM domain-containing protein n=1 Tax=Panagrolaimus davidi TaxID=227884 RepID=A0A914Q7L9_9BILA
MKMENVSDKQQKLINGYCEKKLSQKIATKLAEVVIKLKLNEDNFDNRVIDLFSKFTEDQSMFIIKEIEVYIGQIPFDIFEDKLIPLFESIGQIWDLRIMIDPINGKSHGYAFLVYVDKVHAIEAAKKVGVDWLFLQFFFLLHHFS